MDIALIRFPIEIKEKKGVENAVASHIFGIVIENKEKIDDDFLDKALAMTRKLPWYVDIVNYLS